MGDNGPLQRYIVYFLYFSYTFPSVCGSVLRRADRAFSAHFLAGDSEIRRFFCRSILFFYDTFMSNICFFRILNLMIMNELIMNIEPL